jgi:hypothetical protein
MTKKILCCGATAIVGLALSAQGSILAQDTWEGGAEAGWNIQAVPPAPLPIGSIGNPESVGGRNALGIHASTGAGISEDIVRTTDAAFTGNYLNYGGAGKVVTSVMFDFYSNTGGNPFPYPAALSLYFLYNDGGSAWEWYYDFDVTLLDAGWGTGDNDLSAALSFGAGWYTLNGQNTPDGFALSLTDVDRIGILVSYQPSQSGQVYGIDDFTLDGVVPEPGTYAMLGFSLLSLGATFRRKLSAKLASLRQS